MSLEVIHLRKLLKLLYSEPNRRVAALRSDIRDDISRELGASSGGGDFYGPFWRDAKDHVFGISDLHQTTKSRIESNAGRANLYPRLRDGFLLWWNERRRWTNEPFIQAQLFNSVYRHPTLNVQVKVENILSVRGSRKDDHFIYPYFSPDPVLNDESARLGLWIISESLVQVPVEELRILDVMRGQNFSLERSPLHGNEQNIFERKFLELAEEWAALRTEY
jgi:hypothetical protein